MTTWKAKTPVRRATATVLGRTYIRLICGTCRHRSRWTKPEHLDQKDWARAHFLNNVYCATSGKA